MGEIDELCEAAAKKLSQSAIPAAARGRPVDRIAPKDERARQKKHLSDWSAQETKKREAKEAKERKQARGRPVDRASRGRIKKPPKYWKAISDYWKADNARRRGDQKTPTRDWEEALVDFGRRHEAAKKQPLQH